ncbi:hypothetical protein F4776DRAFT_355648 [Hypoxylon sp. NC0597]|nr:hypothetical protein F4776DRAFT_355648 [Hypoxylon sp. NC0597]
MASNVFFQGSLQDGISLAIQQAKMVLAFVTDDSDESQSWENELLTNDSLKSPLENYAVALRLPAGSEEAGYLEALFPIPKKPTIVIIQSGTLKEYLQGGTPKEDLVRRIAAILNTAAAGQSQQTTPAPARQTHQPPSAPVSRGHDVTDDLYDDYDEPATSSNPPAPPPAQPTSAQNLQEAKRLEAEKKAKEAKLKAEREAKAKERRNVNEGNSGHHGAAERTYAEEIRQKKIHAAEERKRILKRIEDDKRERREREAQEKQARLLLSATHDEGSSSQTPAIPLPRRQEGSMHGDHCNLQVRLFDGSTIRSRFKNDATLAGDVRRWIDEERTDGDAPYTFRIVLSPLPNKAIEPTEETGSLLSLGLAPSATLVLVPAKYSSAYAHSNNLILRSLLYLLGIFGAGYGLLTGALGGIMGMLFGSRARQTRAEGIPLQNIATGRTPKRIRGFQNPEDERRDAQLYNGNSLNFEPRRDDEEDHESN